MKVRSNRFWLCLLGGLMALSAGTSLWIFLRVTPGTTAVITLNGLEVERIDLSTVTEEYTLSYTGSSGITNLVQISPGKIRVAQSNCPDQVCVHQGWIETGAAPIVCLPNALVIQIEDTGHSELDGVVG